MNKNLFETEPLSLMISSRCNDDFLYENKDQPIGNLRSAIKEQLEKITLGGKQVFRVWIHEDESNGSALINSWDACIEKSRSADVFLLLYNGRAGWLGDDSPVKDGIGICHAELSAAFNKAPSKVRSIHLGSLAKAKTGTPDEAFQDYVKQLKLSGAQVKTGEDALVRAQELAASVVLSLAREGVGINSSGSYFAGEALEWSRMNFQRRRTVMTQAMVELIRRRDTSSIEQSTDNVAAVRIRGSIVGFVCDSVPASMSTAAARELVGQPFLRDHLHTDSWEPDVHGPVHVIACQKRVTEAQAVRQLGFPDAIVVTHRFGVYVADDVQKIQMAFIANCRDETTTKEGVQAFLNWLDEHGEIQYLVQRATDRRKISNCVRDVNCGTKSSPSWPL